MTERFLGMTLAVWLVLSCVSTGALMQPSAFQQPDQLQPLVTVLA